MDATWLYVRRVRELVPGAASAPTPVPEPSEEIRSIDLVKEYGLDPTKPFDPVAFRKHWDSWAPDLIRHLRAEIDTLGPEMTTAVGKDNLARIQKEVVKHLQAYDPAWFLCSVFGESRSFLVDEW